MQTIENQLIIFFINVFKDIIIMVIYSGIFKRILFVYSDLQYCIVKRFRCKLVKYIKLICLKLRI